MLAGQALAQPPAPFPEGLTPEEKRDIGVFRRAQASVIFITAIALRRDIFTMDVFQIPQGSGSGFVWDRQGHIVTNFHVIHDGNAFAVTLSDQSEWEAKVVGNDSHRSRSGLPATSSSASASSRSETRSASITR